MSILWPKFPTSGICDRLQVLLFMISYARIKNKKLLTIWPSYEIRDGLDLSYRKHDYEIQNFKKFFNIPDYYVEFTDINRLNKLIKRNSQNEFFDHSLSCTDTIKVLHDNYLNNHDFSEYQKIYDDTTKLFTPKINSYSDKFYIGIHIRRTDKVRYIAVDNYMISDAELDDLNKKTKICILNFISKGFNTFYIASDDPNAFNDYSSYIINNGGIVILPICDYGIDRTYYDLIALYNSSLVISSQRYSNFSLVPCLLKKKPMIIFCANDQPFKSFMDIPYYNFIFDYEKFFINENTCILSHQGYADLFNVNGLYIFYALRYNKVKILVLTIDRKQILDYIFEKFSNISVDVPDFTSFGENRKQNKDSCIICHTYGSPKQCPRIKKTTCKYVDYNKYIKEGYTINKLHCFDNYDKWDQFLKKQISFAHAFYNYYNINTDFRTNLFTIPLDKINNLMNKKFKLESNKYIIIHEDPKRKIIIDRKYVHNTQYIEFNVNEKSLFLIDLLSLFLNSYGDIHLIESSWSVILYLILCRYKLPQLLEKNIYIHVGDKHRDIHIYSNPIMSNITIIRNL